MKARGYTTTRYLPFGDSGLLIEFGNTISIEVNRKVTDLAETITKTNIQGVRELVPTYRSLLVRFDPLETTYEQLVFCVKTVEEKTQQESAEAEPRKIIIPTVYGGAYGPDLGFVAEYHGLTEEQVVKLHSEKEYRVYMIGFVAGFPYLGKVSDKIATPRLETPRIKVPAGSVGIAEKQTGIYPCEAPGGWQIIGRTPMKLFNVSREPPALLRAGDIVKFKPISEEQDRLPEKSKQHPFLEEEEIK